MGKSTRPVYKGRALKTGRMRVSMICLSGQPNQSKLSRVLI